MCCNEGSIADGEKETYRQSVLESSVFGGRHTRVDSQKTFELHWRTYRAFVGYLLRQGVLHPPVTSADACTEDNFRTYFRHLQTDNSARGRAFHPDTVNLAARCLSVWTRIMVGEGTGDKGESREIGESYSPLQSQCPGCALRARLLP